MRLEDDQLDALAELIAARLGDAHPPRALVDARALAEHLGVSRAYVYRHRRELGGKAIGAGPRPTIRFDLQAAVQAHERPPQRPQPERRQPAGPRRRPAAPGGAPLLPVRGRR
jgi:hypothetical protein